MYSGRILARNFGINLAGTAAPMVAALLAIPLLIDRLGTERFGFITVAWVLIGYFGLFDLGIGRALTKAVADRIGRNSHEEIAGLTWTALVLMAGLGGIGAAVIAVLAPWLVTSAFKIPEALHAEAISAIYILAFSLPWVIATAGLRGLLEAGQHFGLLNALRVPMGLLNYLGPLAILPFSTSLVAVIAVLAVLRVLGFFAHFVACASAYDGLTKRAPIRRTEVADLLRTGGWMTVSNVVSPLMTYLDRFLIAGLISMAAVAYYVTPYEVVTKLSIIPGALVGVLFPAIAASYVRDARQTVELFWGGLRVVYLIMFPLTLIVVAFAGEGLTLWLGAEFASSSTRVLQWLAVGVFFNCLAHVPYALLQGIGRPDVTGKLHLLEIAPYLVALIVLANSHGIEGVAVAWAARVALDLFFLMLAVVRYLEGSMRVTRQLATMVGISVGVLVLAAVPVEIPLKLALVGTFLLGFGLAGWYGILRPTERALVRVRHT